MIGVHLSWRSLRAWRPLVSGSVNYAIWRIAQPIGQAMPMRRFWCDVWTPIWHEGRGPYVSIGLGIVAIGRGY